MKKVGELLMVARIKKGFSLEDVSKHTKIQEKYLRAIEESRYSQLPAVAFVKGFIQNYAKAVNAKPDTMLAVFRRDFSQDKLGKIIPRSLSEPINSKLTISPKTTTSIIVGIIALLVISLFARQIIYFYKGPEITINKPGEGQVVTSPLEVSGSASVEDGVSVNSQDILTDKNGDFATQIQLNPGSHIITITATNRDGRSTTVQRQVNVSP